MRDTVTTTIRIEADFETLQRLRRALADERRRADLTALAGDTVAAYLRSLGAAGFRLEADLTVPRERRPRPGPRSPLPKVEAGRLHWYATASGQYAPLCPLDSAAWFAWLAADHSRSFRYEAEGGVSFTARRRANGQWYAAKRIKGKLHRRYLGVSRRVTAEKLAAAARSLAAVGEGG